MTTFPSSCSFCVNKGTSSKANLLTHVPVMLEGFFPPFLRSLFYPLPIDFHSKTEEGFAVLPLVSLLLTLKEEVN